MSTGEQLACLLGRQPEANSERARGREPRLERRRVPPDVRVDGGPAAARMNGRTGGEVKGGVPIELHGGGLRLVNRGVHTRMCAPEARADYFSPLYGSQRELCTRSPGRSTA